MLRSGLVSITFRKLTPAEVVALCVRAGVDGIEWGGDVHVPHGDFARAREVARLASGAGLAAAAYGSYYRAGASEAEGLAFASVAATARELGAPTVRVWAGTKGSAAASAEERAAVAADLRRISGIAAGAGLTVSLEFHGDTLTDTAASAVALLEEAAHPALHSLWQPAVGRNAEERRADLAAVAPWLTNVHVFQWGPSGWNDRRPLAEGEAEWRSYLDLAAIGAGDRYALLEFAAADDPEAFVRDAAALNRWLGGAGTGT